MKQNIKIASSQGKTGKRFSLGTQPCVGMPGSEVAWIVFTALVRILFY